MRSGRHRRIVAPSPPPLSLALRFKQLRVAWPAFCAVTGLYYGDIFAHRVISLNLRLSTSIQRIIQRLCIVCGCATPQPKVHCAAMPVSTISRSTANTSNAHGWVRDALYVPDGVGGVNLQLNSAFFTRLPHRIRLLIYLELFGNRFIHLRLDLVKVWSHRVCQLTRPELPHGQCETSVEARASGPPRRARVCINVLRTCRAR